MSVGSVLVQQREKLGHDLPSMAAYLHIRLPYLQAIETDAFDQLPPGNAYRVGFLKSYATALGLNVDEIIALYRKEQGATQKIPLRMRLPIREESSSTLGFIGLLVVLIAAGWIAFAWLHHSGDRRVADAVPPVPDRLQPQAAPAAAAATAETGEADEARDESEAQTAPKQAAPTATSPAPGVQSGSAYGFDDGPSRVTITVSADTWLQISQAGKPAFTGVLHPGDSYRIPDQPGWTMTSGNAAGVSLVVDGKPGAPLGAAGAVIRDVPLDAGGVAATHP